MNDAGMEGLMGALRIALAGMGEEEARDLLIVVCPSPSDGAAHVIHSIDDRALRRSLADALEIAAEALRQGEAKGPEEKTH